MSTAGVENMTIGMRLDAFIARLDSLSPTQLYGVTVLSSIVFCFLLLNTGRLSHVDHQQFGSSIQTKTTSKAAPSSSKQDVPQPKWYILNALNVVAAVSFIVSVVTFLSDASTYMSDSFSIVKFLAGWSLFLCYFFGFFGISFVDADVLEESASVKPLPTKSKEFSKSVSSSGVKIR